MKISKTVVVTGAAGFIGSALVRRLAAEGYEVLGLDNFSRVGSVFNAKSTSRLGISIHRIDVSDRRSLFDFFRNHERKNIVAVFHLAAQVAVTRSYTDPLTDFASNAIGSFNIVEAARLFAPKAHLVYASTNKVYGAADFSAPVGLAAVPSPKTPYGVSKFVGDLYFEEYRGDEIGLSSTVFRQSCIYGPGQMGVEDQGWAAWFSLSCLLDRTVNIYGDGTQVRDMLFIEDLVELYLLAAEKRVQGTFVVGGGEENSVQVFDAYQTISSILGSNENNINYSDWRPGDQRYFVSRNEGLLEKFNWQASTGLGEGLQSLVNWQKSNLSSLEKLLAY